MSDEYTNEVIGARFSVVDRQSTHFGRQGTVKGILTSGGDSHVSVVFDDPMPETWIPMNDIKLIPPSEYGHSVEWGMGDDGSPEVIEGALLDGYARKLVGLLAANLRRHTNDSNRAQAVAAVVPLLMTWTLDDPNAGQSE